jgi:hypothetical protein
MGRGARSSEEDCFSFYLTCFFFNNMGKKKPGGRGSARRWGGMGWGGMGWQGEVVKTMYAHVNKCKNNKMNFLKKESPNKEKPRTQ